MAEKEHWQWQEYGTAWKGVGIYHITLTVPSREPLLGTLVIPDDDPAQARVERTELGEVVVQIMFDVQHYHRDIQILHFVVMPDHIHTVWYVRRPMRKGILSVVQGLWTGVKKLGRAWTYAVEGGAAHSVTETRSRLKGEKGRDPSDTREIIRSESPSNTREMEKKKEGVTSLLLPTVSRESYKCNTLRMKIGDKAYYALSPIFTEKPFVRPMSQHRQLPATIRYIDMNPQRLATKRLKPGYFRVQHDVEINGRKYDAVGNIALLQAEDYMPVHVRHTMIEAAVKGDDKPLREYMNSCVKAARKGAVMVSPFIHEKEREVMVVLLAEEHPIIYIADNGFGEYYKPSDGLFDTVAAGRMLILSPWEYDPKKRSVTREECVAMNKMAEEISYSSIN